MNDTSSAGPSALRQWVRKGMTASLPRRLFMTSGPRTGAEVALTFDDGPHPVHTPTLLDALRELRIRATFFVLGRNAEAHPLIVRRMLDEGHEVGGHSYAHTEPGVTSAGQLAQEIVRTEALLRRLGAQPVRLFRPPHGKITASKTVGSWLLRQTVVLWNRDPKDFAMTAPGELAAWFQNAPLEGGDIILLHDVHPWAAAALPTLAERARNTGLRFCTPSQWLS